MSDPGLDLVELFERNFGQSRELATNSARKLLGVMQINAASKADLRELEQHMDRRFDEMSRQIMRLEIKGLLLAAASIGVLFTILRLWPPHL